MAKDSILDVLCLCTSLLRNLYKEGKHTFVAKQAWVALDFVWTTIVVQQWFLFDVPCLMGYGGSLDDLVQPPQQSQLCERWVNQSVLLKVLHILEPTSSIEFLVRDYLASFYLISFYGTLPW